MFFTSIGIGYYYVFNNENSRVSMVNPKGLLNWPEEAASAVMYDCKELPFHDKDERIAYTSRLFLAAGGDMIYNQDKDSFLSPSNKVFTQGYLRVNVNTFLQGSGSGVCLIVWVGDNNGVGIVAYDSVRGETKKIKVSNFPTP